jgi:hypothetical protein
MALSDELLSRSNGVVLARNYGIRLGEFNDELDTTTFLASGGVKLDSPFKQSNLRRVAIDKHVSENDSRQPAYVVQRPGDFPGSLSEKSARTGVRAVDHEDSAVAR